MDTRRARFRDPIARVALIGALALAVAFGAVALDTAATPAHSGDAQHAVIVPREARPVVVGAGTKDSRGNAWVASLFAVCAFIALSGYMLRAQRRAGYRRGAARFSVRLRAPPALLVAR